MSGPRGDGDRQSTTAARSKELEGLAWMQQLILGPLCSWKHLALEVSHSFHKVGQVQNVVTILATMIKLAPTAPRQPGKCLELCLVLSWQLLNIQAPKPPGYCRHPLFAVAHTRCPQAWSHKWWDDLACPESPCTPYLIALPGCSNPEIGCAWHQLGHGGLM